MATRSYMVHVPQDMESLKEMGQVASGKNGLGVSFEGVSGVACVGVCWLPQ